MPDVLVVGAGPAGTLVTAELARRGVDVRQLERRDGPAEGSRAIGVHSPVLAALEASGATERLLAEACRVYAGEARSRGELLGTVRFDRLSRRFPFVATLAQPLTQQVLGAHAPPPLVGEVTAIRADAGGVTVWATGPDGPHEVRAGIVVNGGGPHARPLVYRPGAVRGKKLPDRYVMADVPAPGDDTAVVHLDARGVLESFPLPGGKRRFVAPAPPGMPDDPATAGAVLREALAARRQHEALEAVDSASLFWIRRVIAPRMRRGRVIAIGDAVHEISPMGGQGMNLGLLDAVTLAPLLAEWVARGQAPDAELARWERRRVRSARIGGAISTMNTVLGRAASPAVDAFRRRALRAGLATPLATVFAHAYSMGFDADA